MNDIKTWRERMQDDGHSWCKPEGCQEVFMSEEIADLRAALSRQSVAPADCTYPNCGCVGGTTSTCAKAAAPQSVAVGSEQSLTDAFNAMQERRELESVVSDDNELSSLLRTYANNNGYSHNDYADAMLQAADEIERLTKPAGEPVAYLNLKKLEAGGMCYATKWNSTDAQSPVYARQAVGLDETAICVGMDALRILAGAEPKNFTLDQVITALQCVQKEAHPAPAAQAAPSEWRDAMQGMVDFCHKAGYDCQRAVALLAATPSPAVLERDTFEFQTIEQCVEWYEQRLAVQANGAADMFRKITELEAAQPDTAAVRDAAQVADVIQKLMSENVIDWTPQGQDYEGADDGGFNSNEEERAVLVDQVRKAMAALQSTPATPPDSTVQDRVPENVPADRFENAIREFGVSSACEWFGHAADSEFTLETIKVMNERLADAQPSAAPAGKEGPGHD